VEENRTWDVEENCKGKENRERKGKPWGGKKPAHT